jgi:hypothetical protein
LNSTIQLFRAKGVTQGEGDMVLEGMGEGGNMDTQKDKRGHLEGVGEDGNAGTNKNTHIVNMKYGESFTG